MEDIKVDTTVIIPDSEEDKLLITAKDISCMYGTSIAVRRWAGTIIDYIILAIMFITSNLGYGIKENNPFHVMSLFMPFVTYILFLSYYIVLEGLTGYTIGKAVLRVKVVDNGFNTPGILKAFLRTITRLIEVNPFLFGGLPAGIITLSTRSKQRLGDIVASTYVMEVRDIPAQYKSSRLKKFKKNIVKVYAVLFIFSFAFSLIGIGNLITGISNDGFLNNKVLLTKDNKYQVTLPAGWFDLKALQDKDSKSDFIAGNVYKEMFLTINTEDKSSFSQDVDMSTIVQAMNITISRIYGNAKINNTSYPNINGHSAAQFEVLGDIGETRMYILLTMVETPEAFYQIAAWIPEEKVGSLEKRELQNVTFSFRDKVG